MEEKVVIVVPVFKDFSLVTDQEIISLRRLFTTLGSHQIHFIGPENLAFDGCLKEASNNKVFPKVERFADKYFTCIEGYNELMISLDFYKRFGQFKYLLIYQLDAYVFRDELKYWCSKGYDYIGAPWNGMHHYYDTLIEGVGNGGFSLRKVKSAIKLLEKIRMNEVLQQYREYNWKGLILKLPLILRSVWKAKSEPSKCEQNYHFQEDYFWCNVGPAALNSFECRSGILKILHRFFISFQYKIAPTNVAATFSLETNVRQLFIKNNKKLPFGCHAWEKYEPDFWKEFIPMNELVK